MNNSRVLGIGLTVSGSIYRIFQFYAGAISNYGLRLSFASHSFEHSSSRMRNRNLPLNEESNAPTKQRVMMDPKRVILGFMPRKKCNVNLWNVQDFTKASEEIDRFGLNISFRNKLQGPLTRSVGGTLAGEGCSCRHWQDTGTSPWCGTLGEVG